jgi:cyanophycin synthetase
MFDLTRHPRLLRLLSLADRLKHRFTRKKNGRAQADVQLAHFYKRIWQDAAQAVGGTLVDLGNDALEIRLGQQWTRVCQNSTDIDSLGNHRVVRIKPAMYKLLSAHGLPVPRHVEFSLADMQPAVEFLEQKPRECVIKPACGTGGGLAVTTGVRTRWQLARAAWLASVWGDHPLIEEQVAGQNYRLLYLDGQLIDVVKREPPAVIADGTATVRQLVERANQERLNQQGTLSHTQLTLDYDMQATLERQGLSFRSMPPRGTRVQIKTVINENCALENVTALDELCPAIIAEGAAAAAISGLRLAGVDIITADPSRSLRESGGVFLEVNSPPGYFWHYHKRDGAFPLAVHVLKALFQLSAEGEPAQTASEACPALSS